MLIVVPEDHHKNKSSFPVYCGTRLKNFVKMTQITVQLFKLHVFAFFFKSFPSSFSTDFVQSLLKSFMYMYSVYMYQVHVVLYDMEVKCM